MLKIGQKAPAFNLEASSGGKLSLKDLSGKFGVIVFYPKNNTPGWNLQLASLEAFKPQFEALNARVLAINPASVDSHKNYCNKKGFTFPILSDPEGKIVDKYKCRKEDGKGVQRTVYAFNPTGEIIFAERGMADYNDVIEAIKA